ncbi:hypothetical protein LZQ00_00710 [Sphingobacterium sp. SRCM116780]|uniref:hypothetical protein n=1 Tax=Sphingobacterium sp. SRCM116780 TaxID=2907623 RepID=UPI001F2DEDAA|nr:hypothetical protein [Sphingobacterium sp. SRCM116780]UIR56363.1 hypothetical protein LZQ00_00710 [Sphingobacterium sp. SRCM116780]
MANEQITDQYIEDVIKSNHTYNPNLNKTQGEKLRELVKNLRDHIGEVGAGSELFINSELDREPDLAFFRANYGADFETGSHVYFIKLLKLYIKVKDSSWIWWDVNLLTDEEYTFSIDVVPADAEVIINGEVRNSIIARPGTEINWSISRLNYKPASGYARIGDRDEALQIQLIPILNNADIIFKVKTTVANTKVPTILLRTDTVEGLAKLEYGDGQEELVNIPVYNGDDQWIDSEGTIHYIDAGNTFYHTYAEPGTYQIKVTTGDSVNYFRLCEALTKSSAGYMAPSINNFVVEIVKVKSATLTNLDYSLAGLPNATVVSGFQLETPEVETMVATFYEFGRNITTLRWSFPATMLSQITKPTELTGTFFRCGFRKIETGFLDSFVNLTSVWEIFKNSYLGFDYYKGIDGGAFRSSSVNGTDDFVPVSLFWKNKYLTDISHAFNFIGNGNFGNFTSGYNSFFVIRRELFWNGKDVGNANGTIATALYTFGKCNRILFEPNIFKHVPNISIIGGMFTQTSFTSHPIAWATMIPIARSESTIVTSVTAEGVVNTGNGKGLTFDLNVIFPNSYPSVTCMNGAFTCAADGVDYGFNNPIDYVPNGIAGMKFSQAFSGADFLAKFPNAKANSVSASAKMLLGQTAGTETDKSDGRNGALYRLNQADGRLTDAATLPALVFNNAVAY